MPELPEVETIARGLQKRLAGRRFVEARLRLPGLYRRGSLRVSWLLGRRIGRVDRVGKNAVFHLVPPGVMVVNLGMTGRLLLASGSADRPMREKHLHGRFHFDGGLELRYYDPRRFGFLYVSRSPDVAGELGLGPDPFRADPRYLARILRGRRAPVKPLLLDQRIVSGLGNIYTDETLFVARMDPRTPGDRAAHHAGRILSSARRVLDRAISRRGSTIRDYRLPDGDEGDYQRFHAVYGREGEACVRCGAPIEKIVLHGRGTHFCPSCQRWRGR